MWEVHCAMRCVTSPLEREVGFPMALSDTVIFVPHNLGDTGLRTTKDETVAAAPIPAKCKLWCG